MINSEQSIEFCSGDALSNTERKHCGRRKEKEPVTLSNYQHTQVLKEVTGRRNSVVCLDSRMCFRILHTISKLIQ